MFTTILGLLTNGGLGMLGSIATKITGAIFDLKAKEKEIELKKLEYASLKEDREAERNLLETKLKYQKELKELERQEADAERDSKKDLAYIQQDTDVYEANAEVDKKRWDNFYLPSTSKSWVDVFNAMIRPTVAMLMTIALVVAFGFMTYKAITGTEEVYKSIMESDAMHIILALCENIVTFYFGNRTLQKK